MPSKSKLSRNRSKICILLGIVGALALAGGPRARADSLTTACGLLSTGQTGKAAALFAQTLLDQPGCLEAKVGWGITLLRQGQPDPAQQAFESALATDPTLAAAHMGRAAALLQAGHYTEAEAEYAGVATGTGPAATAAAAGEAWLECVRGDYAGAQQLADRLPATQDSLAAYVLAASAFALGAPSAAASLVPPALAPSYVGLGSSLTAPGAEWLKHPSLVAAEVPAAGAYRSAEPPVGGLTIVAPAAGTTVRGQVALIVRGDLDSAPAYVVVSVGSRFVGVNHGLVFTEPLDASTWPGGAQPLQVDAYDAQGRLLARGQTTVTVGTGDMTLAEPAPSPAVAWVRRQLEQALTPEVLPGVWEQLRGEMAWQQGRLSEAQNLLTVAFQTDPHLPRAREELLAVSQALGLPVMQSHPKLVEVPTQRRMVALTFDDGPHPKVTPWVLDQLERFGAHATFFVVGKQVEMYPELAREILARGNEIGSHTYSHTDLTKLTPLDVERELATSRAVIAQATGTQVTLFRPPGGDYDGEVGRAVSLWGFTSVFWTCNITSFYTNPRDHVVAGMLRKISPGGIVLLHNGEDLTTAILPDLLAALKADGYQMCTVSELLAARS